MTHRAVMALADSERTGPAVGSRSLDLGLLTIPRSQQANKRASKNLILDDDGPRVLPQGGNQLGVEKYPYRHLRLCLRYLGVGVIAVQHGLFLEPRSGRTYGPHGSRALFLLLWLAKD